MAFQGFAELTHASMQQCMDTSGYKIMDLSCSHSLQVKLACKFQYKEPQICIVPESVMHQFRLHSVI